MEGSKDHPLLKRYRGSVIIKHSHQDHDEYTIPLGKAESEAKLSESRRVKGEVTRLTYKVPMGRSSLEVIRNYENEFPREGSEPPTFPAPMMNSALILARPLAIPPFSSDLPGLHHHLSGS